MYLAIYTIAIIYTISALIQDIVDFGTIIMQNMENQQTFYIAHFIDSEEPWNLKYGMVVTYTI